MAGPRRNRGPIPRGIMVKITEDIVELPRFMALWCIWPPRRRGSRRIAVQNYKKAIRREPEVSRCTLDVRMIESAQEWVYHWAKEDVPEKYIPLLETWLNKDGWLREVPRDWNPAETFTRRPSGDR